MQIYIFTCILQEKIQFQTFAIGFKQWHVIFPKQVSAREQSLVVLKCL